MEHFKTALNQHSSSLTHKMFRGEPAYVPADQLNHKHFRIYRFRLTVFTSCARYMTFIAVPVRRPSPIM